MLCFYETLTYRGESQPRTRRPCVICRQRSGGFDKGRYIDNLLRRGLDVVKIEINQSIQLLPDPVNNVHLDYSRNVTNFPLPLFSVLCARRIFCCSVGEFFKLSAIIATVAEEHDMCICVGTMTTVVDHIFSIGHLTAFRIMTWSSSGHSAKNVSCAYSVSPMKVTTRRSSERFLRGFTEHGSHMRMYVCKQVSRPSCNTTPTSIQHRYGYT